MTLVLVALIASLGTVLAATVPALIAHRSRIAAESSAATGVDVLAAVHRLEGKVDLLHERMTHHEDVVHARQPLKVAASRRR